ncbi:MAG: hypothetical protein MJ142_06060 [Clostridia bacterium]|nr:hypothetical protein [Clostridia bacterium]
MKKYTRIVLACMLCLLMTLTAVTASAAQTGYYDDCYNMIHITDAVNGRLTMKMATRTGPSTRFTEPGTFFKAGETVRCISQTKDDGGVVWVQVEFTYRGALMRAYTGLKRLNVDTSKLVWENDYRKFESIDCCIPWDTQYGYTGPGYQYARCDFKVYAQEQYYVIAEENGWFQLQTQDLQSGMIRCWVPMGNVMY